ncbi:MAG TPA: hypothetical protein VFU13_05240 [Steroidobacteraceae bacterium]|nr:hypothetical protein [Steroidobacteraceae bacterium]
MLKTSHRAVAFAALACVCACMFAACDDAPSEKPRSAATGDKPPSAKHADVTANMVAAVSAGKAASAISVHFALRAPPVANTPLPLDLAIVPHGKFSLVRVYLESHDGLTITSGGEFGPANSVEAEKPLMHQLVLLPARDGMFVVTATVETVDEGGNVTRVFSIPVIVGATPAPTPASAPESAPASVPATQ